MQLHQQKGMISLSPPTICNSAGKTWREAKRQHDETISGSKATLTDTIRTFTALGASLLEARSDGTP
ncbi:hypothetical protein, partial [Enterococcus faecalis]